MAAFTVSTSQNIDQLAGKTGGDTYAVSGGTLTIDQDSRVGSNQSTSSTLGNMSVSATLGGIINIDGTAVWMIPYTGGSGNVPAWNTVISNGSGSGKLIAVHASLTSASTATGSAMPTSGFLRVKQKTGSFVAGALTGISATATDAGRIGWLEIVGDESATVTSNRLGAVNITGAWYEVGITSGVSNQTIQIPNNGLQRYVAGVFIEKTAGSEDYEFYPNAGTATTIGTDADRGKVVWIDNTGLLRIGNSGSATNGYTPIAGLKVVIGNIFFENCTTATRTANVIPNATINTRYDFQTSGGGVVNVDKCNMAWYLSCGQAYSLNLRNSGFVDAINISEVATAINASKIGVGNKPTTALLVSGLTLASCYQGGTFDECVFQRVSMASANATTVTMNDCYGFTFNDFTVRANTIRTNASVYSINAGRLRNCVFNTPKIIEGSINIFTSDNVEINDTVYVNNVSGTTNSTYTSYVWQLSSGASNIKISGLVMPVTNCQPYTALLYVLTGSFNVKLRNIGSRLNRLDLGSVNGCGYIYQLATSASNIKIQRVYTSNTRLDIMLGDNSCQNVVEENVFGDYADATGVMAVLNFQRKGIGTTGALTSQSGVYGSHFINSFTSETAGRIAILMNETTPETASQVTLINSSKFTATGGLYMPTIGNEVLFEIPYYMLGHTGFSNTALVMAGGTSTNYGYKYQIDKNDGAGWSAESVTLTPTTLGTALNAITGIDASLGFKLRLRITTSTTNTTSITSVYLTTTSTAISQDYLYPLDVITLSLTGLKDNTEIRVYITETTTELGGIESATDGTPDNRSFSFSITAGVIVDIAIINVTYENERITAYTVPTTNSSIPVQQRFDRNYAN